MVDVTLHIYDVTNTANDNLNGAVQMINSVTRELSWGGIFHGAIEVYGQEWSFGYVATGTGVYCVPPTTNTMYQYRESVSLGKSTLTHSEVRMPFSATMPSRHHSVVMCC